MATFNNGKNKSQQSNSANRRTSGPGKADFKVVEPRCNVCRSQYRDAIDRLLIAGNSYVSIVRVFHTENLSRQSVSNHHKNHVSVEAEAIRKILEAEARKYGEEIDTAEQSFINRSTYLQTALHLGYQSLVDKEVIVEPRDMVMVIKLMQELDEKKAAIQLEELMREASAFQEAVKRVLPPEQFTNVLSEFSKILEREDKIVEALAIEMPTLTLAAPKEMKKEEVTEHDG